MKKEFCKNCGTVLKNGSCPNCIQQTQPTKVYSSIAATAGQQDIIKRQKKYKSQTKTAKILVIICGVLIFFMIVSNAIATPKAKPVSGSENSQTQAAQLSALKKAIPDLTDGQENAIMEALAACEIKNISYVTAGDADEEGIQPYSLKTEYGASTPVYLFLKSNEVVKIGYKYDIIYENGQVITTPKAINSRPNLEVLESKAEASGYTRYVTGKIRNNTNKTYSYAQVSINLYKGETLVGSTLDNINNLAPNSIWEFQALILENKADTYKIVEVTGF